MGLEFYRKHADILCLLQVPICKYVCILGLIVFIWNWSLFAIDRIYTYLDLNILRILASRACLARLAVCRTFLVFFRDTVGTVVWNEAS